MSGAVQVLYFVASAGNLFLANVVSFRARRGRGALPLALLCISLFAWDFSEGVFFGLQPPSPFYETWYTARLLGSSMAPAFLWHFMLVFSRRDQRLRPTLYLGYVLSTSFALATAGGLVYEPLKQWVWHDRWNLVYLGTLFPFVAASFLLAVLRRRELPPGIERNAATLIVVAVAVGLVMGISELFIDKLPIPPLGHVGSLLCTFIIAIALLRHRLLSRPLPIRRFFFVLLMALSAVAVLVMMSNLLPESRLPVLLLAAAGGMTAIAVYRVSVVRLREQVERRRRLAMIGTMAAGVAHEIRNPLASIKGAAQFVQKDLESAPGREEARDYLRLLVGEVDRLDAVVESFLAYARPMELQRREIPLESFLGDVLRLQSASLPPGVRIETAFDPDVPIVVGDSAQLVHAVTNVVRNALEVMSGGGLLTVRTRGMTTALKSWAVIEIEDDGPGLPPGEAERIFQPFYTTKAKGTGLGLAIAMRVAEAHGGDLLAENVEPHGCRFTFLLPLPVL